MIKQVFFCICGMLFLFGTPVFAGKGHYTAGVEGLKAGSAPPPGFYWRMYQAFYSADEFRDNNKNKTADFDVDVYALVNRFIYSTPVESLGADLVMNAIIPVQYTDISMKGVFSENRFELGDILLEPVILSWHGDRYDALAGVGIYVPTGKFDDKPANAGKGFWTFMLTAGGTVYLDAAKTWSASALARYQTNSRQDHTHITVGDFFHVEWGVGKMVNNRLEVGVAGYNSWQVSNDSGRGSSNLRERSNAVGPEVTYAIPSWGMQLSLRSLWEYKNKNASQGNITTLTLTKAF